MGYFWIAAGFTIMCQKYAHLCLIEQITLQSVQGILRFSYAPIFTLSEKQTQMKNGTLIGLDQFILVQIAPV